MAGATLALFESPTLCRNAVFKRRIDEIGPMIVVRPMEDTLSLFGSRFLCHNRINFVSRYETH
jgi:hypothetical protein